MQSKSEEEQLLAEIRGKTITTTVKETSPLGVRIEANDDSEVVGRYVARNLETVSMFLKLDGTYEWETRGMQTTREGDWIVVNGKGTGRSVSHTNAVWEGELVFTTYSTKLAWLNKVRGRTVGTGDFSTGEFQGKVYIKK
jgi:hypothetical protein